jgi:hypothetical protein
MQPLIDLFSQPPASFAWSASADGARTMGTSEGFVLDIWPDRVEAAALFPPDRPDLAARNAALCELLLLAMRPDWVSAPSWLAQAMRQAARGHAEQINVVRGVRFTHDAAQSRATLRIHR